jgi:membrane-bound inhibitor of C-type lysozyme
MRKLFTTAVPCAAKLTKRLAVALAAFSLSSFASAEDITIHLPASASVSRKTVQYQCDAQGAKIAVPSGPFSVEYINGGGNSLVVVPISGKSLIFSNVISGSGARYAAQQFIWWEAKGAVTLYSDSLAGKSQSTCQPISAR